jgi:hypothetical protein
METYENQEEMQLKAAIALRAKKAREATVGAPYRGHALEKKNIDLEKTEQVRAQYDRQKKERKAIVMQVMDRIFRGFGKYACWSQFNTSAVAMYELTYPEVFWAIRKLTEQNKIKEVGFMTWKIKKDYRFNNFETPYTIAPNSPN